MKQLDNCLTLCREIRKIDERLEEMRARAYSPKNQIISDMPKGTGSGDGMTERYIIKCEALKERRTSKKKEMLKNWNEALMIFEQCNIREEYIVLLQNRFLLGLSWKKCAVAMVWSESKCFRVYGEIMHKTKGVSLCKIVKNDN